MYSFLLVLQITGVISSLICILRIGYAKPSRMQKLLFMATVAIFASCLGYLLEMLAGSREAAVMAAKIQYVGNCFIGVLYLAFILDYCHVKKPRYVYPLMVAFSIVMLAVTLSMDYHTLFYSSAVFLEEGVFPHLVIAGGVFYYLYLAVMGMIFTAMLIIIWRYSKICTDTENKRSIYIICTGVLPVCGLILYYSGLCRGYDPTPLSLVGAIICMSFFVHKYKLFDIIEAVRQYTIDSLEEGGIIVDEVLAYMYSNNCAGRLFPELKTFETGRSIAEASEFLQSLFYKSREFKFEIDNRYYEVSISKIYDKQKIKGYTALIYDDTENHAYTEKLIELKNKADVANKAKSSFLANMSHEIRTPLNAILGMTDIILRDAEDEKVLGHADNIKSAGKSLLAIINDILDISKIESGKMEIVNEPYTVSDVMGELENMVNIRLEEKPVEFIIQLEHNVPDRMCGDEVRLKQVLINLLNNAVKFTDKGKIKLSLYFEKINMEKGILYACVEDTGSGIKEEDMDALFQSFMRLELRKNRTIEGTGLGLPICKNIVELMDGEIKAESEYGLGSRFYFHITQKYYAGSKSAAAAIKSKSSRGKKENTQVIRFAAPNAKILVVDDNAINLKVMEGLLEPYKMQVDMAASAKECLKKIREAKYDLVFMDHMMPDMDGVETLCEIRKMDGAYYRKLPVVALTANVVNGIRDSFLEAGFAEYIPKPIEMEALNTCLEKLLPAEDRMEAAAGEADEAGLLSIPGINAEAGLSYVSGNRKAYKSVLKAVCQESHEIKRLIRKCKKQEDWKNYTIYVHGLKGAAAGIGAEELARFARLHEEAGKQKDVEFITREFPAFMDIYDTLVENIQCVMFIEEETEREKEPAAEMENG